MKKRKLAVLLMMLLLCMVFSACAQGEEYTAPSAMNWLDAFAGSLAQLAPLNDPASTADPARAGEYLFEYPFGTVLSRSARIGGGSDILSVEIRTNGIADCRGVSVGMDVSDALGGRVVGDSATQLYVLDIQAAGCGFAWAYLGEQGVYGVEYVTYGGEGLHTEYTLTYVIESGRISAIRIRTAPSTQAQAQEALATVNEIASRQHGEVLAYPNGATMMTPEDLTLLGVRALGVDVAAFVAGIGEPMEIQALQKGGGRMLVYDGALVHVNLDEYTGVEVVRSVSVSSAHHAGPRGLSVGISVPEATALFRCDQQITSLGGALYLEGEALGEAPCGELIAGGAGDVILRYSCMTGKEKTAVLEAVAKDGVIAYWTLYYEDEAKRI